MYEPQRLLIAASLMETFGFCKCHFDPAILDWKSENLTSWQLLLLTNCKTRHQKILSIVTDHLDHYLANAKLLIV